jgi:hypothetical protein
MSKTFPVRYGNTVLSSILIVGAAPNFPAVGISGSNQALFSRKTTQSSRKKWLCSGHRWLKSF